MRQQQKVNVEENGRFPHRKGFDPGLGMEEQERRDREERIKDLLPDEDELLGKAYDGRLVRRLLGYMRPYKSQLVVAIILMVASSLLSVVGPAIIGYAIDDGIRAGSFDVLRFWTFIFIAAAVGEWITNRFRIAIMAYVGTKVVADLRSHLVPLPAHPVAQILQRLQRRPFDEPPDQRRGRHARFHHLVDYGAVPLLLYPVWHCGRHDAAQLAAGAGHLCRAAPDVCFDQLLAQAGARSLPGHAAAAVPDQRLSQRVDFRHSRDQELYARAGQYPLL
jgi:hypothetical protein